MANADQGDGERDLGGSSEVNSLSPPAAGEMSAYGDEGEPSGGAQQGQVPTRSPEKDADHPQGAKTTQANREMARTGSPDQGTH